jgi:hypothetical protein
LRVHITPRSGNAKTGPIPVTTTERASCPTTCPFYDRGCYAKSGPLALHWRKVSDGERGTDWQGLTKFVRSLPERQLWRHNQAGDLPHINGQINGSLLGDLVRANKGRRGFTYTHHKLDVGLNTWYIATANQLGFTVNVSTESKDDAVSSFRKGLPTVVVVPSDHADSDVVDGVKFVTCPAQTNDTMTCAECGLCSQAERQCVVMFKAHGNAKRFVSEVVS